MDENTAWIKFTSTGSVQDYLLYSKLKKEHERSSEGEFMDADKHRGINS